MRENILLSRIPLAASWEKNFNCFSKCLWKKFMTKFSRNLPEVFGFPLTQISKIDDDLWRLLGGPAFKPLKAYMLSENLLPFSNRTLSQCSWATCCTIDGMQCLGTDEERNQQFTLHCVLEKYHAPCNNFPCDNKICLNMIIAPKLDVNWPLSGRGKGRRVCFLGSHRSKMR